MNSWPMERKTMGVRQLLKWSRLSAKRMPMSRDFFITECSASPETCRK